MQKFISRVFALAFVSSAAVIAPSIGHALNREPSLSGSFLASRSAIAARDFDKAAEYLTQALKQDPSNSAMIEQLFQMRIAAGDMAAAEKLAQEVLKSNSQQRMARIVLGLKEFHEHHYEQARTNFSEAAYTPVGELTAALLSAWAYAGENNLNAALKELDKLDGNGALANFKSFHAALIADYLNSAVRADSSYRKAYADAGSSLRVTQAFGNFLMRSGKKDEALKVYQVFLSNSEGNSIVAEAKQKAEKDEKPAPFITSAEAGAGEALFSLAAAMNGDESIDTALLYGRLAAEFNVDKPVTLTLLGDILAGARRFKDAIDIYEKVPKDSVLRTNADTEIAINLQRLDKIKDAQDRMQQIVKREPQNTDAWITLGNTYRNNEQFAEARAAYDSAIKLIAKPDRSNWTVFYYRGICLERLKDWPASEADFRKALELSPDEPSVLNYLGYSLIDMNIKLDEAIAMVKKAVELRPNDGYIVDSLGWAYFRLGDYDQAVVQLERAVDLKAGDPVINEHLGDAYWKVGRKLEAKFQWQHAKDNKPEPEDLKRIEDKLQNGMKEEPPAKPAEGSAPKSSTNG